MVLIGLDDTDNKESRGTGLHSRVLAKQIDDSGLGRVRGITRHQLFFDDRIPYTSHNSSACLQVEAKGMEQLACFCKKSLLEAAVQGSDVGLCIAPDEIVDTEIEQWGLRAKREVLTQKEAYLLAAQKGIYLEGLTGTKDGIIGALAAVGLRKQGGDGRFIWLEGKELRELKGTYTVTQLLAESAIDAVLTKNKTPIHASAHIDMGEWMRPVLWNNKIIVIAEEYKENEKCNWRTATKDYIKSISD